SRGKRGPNSAAPDRRRWSSAHSTPAAPKYTLVDGSPASSSSGWAGQNRSGSKRSSVSSTISRMARRAVSASQASGESAMWRRGSNSSKGPASAIQPALQRRQFGDVALERQRVADVAGIQLLRVAVAGIDGGGDQAGRVGVADQLDGADAGRAPVVAPRLQIEIEIIARIAGGHQQHGIAVDRRELPGEHAAD